MNLSFNHLKVDAKKHTLHPGSRGGHIVGYSSSGEPIYGTLAPKHIERAKWRLSQFENKGNTSSHIGKRTKVTYSRDKMAAWHHVLKSGGYRMEAAEAKHKLMGFS